MSFIEGFRLLSVLLMIWLMIEGSAGQDEIQLCMRLAVHIIYRGTP